MSASSSSRGLDALSMSREYVLAQSWRQYQPKKKEK
jgi:hypothetical protein